MACNHKWEGNVNPYYLMTLLYLSLAILAALDTSLVNLSVLSSFPGQRWLLVHTITLGALSELIFGLAPDLTAALSRLQRPAFRWSTWFLLNVGLIVLYTGIPLINAPLIITGGTLVFIAAGLLIMQLVGLAGKAASVQSDLAVSQDERSIPSPGTRFYIAGLAYLLVGILVGTGLWLGWSEPLRIVTPKEVHVHSNLWGFASMILAGTLFDLYPSFTRRQLARPAMITPVFWLMTVGALGMVSGPWLEVNTFTVVGLVLHTAGTILMLFALIKPLWGKWPEWTLGVWHLMLAYLWFLLAVVVAPLVVAGGVVGAEVAGSGGPILIFGWILQLGFALIPFLLKRSFWPGQPARLGGTAFSLIAINGGSVLYWISLFLASGRSPLRGIAYLLWIISLLPIVLALRSDLGTALERFRALESGQPIEKFG